MANTAARSCPNRWSGCGATHPRWQRNRKQSMQRLLCSIAVFVALAGALPAQDMPLSQIIKEGEGWKELAAGFPRVDLLRDRGHVVTAVHRKGVDHVTFDGKRRLADDGDDIHRPAQARTATGIGYMIRDGDAPGVYRVQPERGPVATPGVKRPAGLTLSVDEGTLVVGDAADKYLWAFRMAKDGSLSHGDNYYPLRVNPGQTESGVTALTTDAAGRVYACTPLGIQVFDPTGRLCGVLLKPGLGELTALTFTGDAHDLLVVACGDKLYVRKMLAKGLP